MYDALWREGATQEEQIECYQRLINSGEAWQFEGHVGRTAMRLIEAGQCMLGTERRRDCWGTIIPARTDVKQGTKGSRGYVAHLAGEEHAKTMEAL